ncbi:cell division ATP-binding protein FtsE [Oceanibacterium hippocampi]|uniref:Cell division ATP-binding protein FtsE n=1 Tax=Oceanibacterium hippocampi TaxID=745714 RepID=A0A1Y5RX72_9PROT|nr:cell division ATP-binding protein FtsE [Oceanibacterium hippocampi]SLN26508.1 Cell division ATP-binding protein FtsE [Oceanibacterium hippocampi]
MVRFQNVGMRYANGPEVLRDISFELAPGSFHFLTGRTGAGKTSMLKLMSLSHRPSRGLVTMFDQDVSRAARADLVALRRRIGVVFQDFRLLDHLSAVDNVALPLRIAGAPANQIGAHVRELLSWVGLEDRMDARPPTLSGGEQQRVAIARAVIARPKLLLADEPTGNIDTTMGHRLMRLFVELNKIGTTVVIATHDESLIARFPNPLLVISQGELRTVPAGVPAFAEAAPADGDAGNG